MLKRITRLAIVLLILLAAGFLWWRFATRYVPDGQPPLATVDAGYIAALKDDFNRASGETRIILLLSPT
jgi:hypothetical protein